MTASNEIGAETAGMLSLDERATQFQDPLERLLYLRLESQLAALSGTELTLLAQHSEERYFEAGAHLMQQGTPAPAVHFVIDGRVTLRRDGVTYRDMAAPAVLGIPAVLSRDPEGVEVIAEVDTITLAVDANVMLDLIEDSFRFMVGALRAFSGQILDAQRTLELNGLAVRSEPEEVPYPKEPLDLVQRLNRIRRGIYANVNMEPLIELIRGAEEIRLEPGTVIWDVGEASEFSVNVVYGVLLCEEPAPAVVEDAQAAAGPAQAARQFRMGPGSIVGALEANASRQRTYKVTAETRVVLIRSRTDHFIDVLEDHTELGMGLLSALARAVVQLQLRVAREVSSS